MSLHVVCEIEAFTVGILEFGEWLSFRIKYLDILDTVDAVVGDCIVSVVIAYQIVFAVFGSHLVRIDYIYHRFAVTSEFWMRFLVGPEIHIVERYLTVIGDCFVKNIYRVEDLLVIYLRIGKRLDVLDMRLKILARQAFDLADELDTLLVGQVI